MDQKPPLALQPEEIAGDRMHTDLRYLREARLPWWRRAETTIRTYLREAMKPVPDESCVGCAVKERQVAHWRRVADEWAQKCRAAEEARESVASQLVAARNLLRRERGDTPLSGRFTVAPGTPVLGGEEEGGVSVLTEPMTPLTYAQVVAWQKPKGPPVIPEAMREIGCLGVGCFNHWGERGKDELCHHRDGKPALTNAEIMARVRGEA